MCNFPEHISHDEMANNIKLKPISAGFVSFRYYVYEGFDIQTYGESINLKLKPLPNDAFMLRGTEE
jgi:hypothetical protein